MKKRAFILVFSVLLFNLSFSQVTKIKHDGVTITTVKNPQQQADDKGQYKYIVQFKEDRYLSLHGRQTPKLLGDQSWIYDNMSP